MMQLILEGAIAKASASRTQCQPGRRRRLILASALSNADLVVDQ